MQNIVQHNHIYNCGAH